MDNNPTGASSDLDEQVYQLYKLLYMAGPAAMHTAAMLMGYETAKAIDDRFYQIATTPALRLALVRRLLVELEAPPELIETELQAQLAEAQSLPRVRPTVQIVSGPRRLVAYGRQLRLVPAGPHDQAQEAILLMSMN